MKIRQKTLLRNIKSFFNFCHYLIESLNLLCKKCHHATEHEKILCSQCKKHYHNPRYPVCYFCNEKNKYGIDRDTIPCATEIDGYCNHAGEYAYGEKIKCKRTTCMDYRPANFFSRKKRNELIVFK